MLLKMNGMLGGGRMGEKEEEKEKEEEEDLSSIQDLITWSFTHTGNYRKQDGTLIKKR